MTKNVFAAAICAALLSVSGMTVAAGPAGFDAPSAAATAPKGFTPDTMTVKQVVSDARDEAHVMLRGKFTKHIRGDKYEFVDEAGTAIEAELDDDRDWSMITKDALVEIRAEVDRDWNSVELEVKSARALQ